MNQYRGRFCWYELATTDTEAAKRFYTEVIGWGTKVFEGEFGRYDMWTVGDKQVGGLMELPKEARAKGAPPYWLGYIHSTDVDGDVRKTSELGGRTLVPPTDIPTVGRFAVVADPQGATIAFFAPSEEPPPESAKPTGEGAGEFCWHELATSDPDKAFKFYKLLFGWKQIEAMDMGPAGVYQICGRGEEKYGGIYRKPADMKAPPNWLYYTQVPDVTKAAEKVKKLGGKVLNGPMEVPGGVIVQCLDPQGAVFALHATAAKK